MTLCAVLPVATRETKMAMFGCNARSLRTWFQAAALLFLVLPFAPAQSLADDKLSLRLDWIPNGSHAPFFLAEQKGWFRKAGLDVTIEDGTGSVVTVQLVGAGQFDVGHANLSSLAIARGKGLPVISYAVFCLKKKNITAQLTTIHITLELTLC